MTLEQFWNTLLKRWLLILACVAVVGAGAYLKDKVTTPVYQATALVQVAVSAGSTSLDDLLASNQLVQTEVVLATSGPVLREVASHHPGVKVDDLATSVTVSAKTNALVFQIDVHSSTPTLAADLANDIAQTLISQQTALQKHSVRNDKVPPAQFLFLAQPAQPPKSYVLPNTRLDGELGLAAGLLLGILLALLFERMDTRIRTIKALLQVTPWPVLCSLQFSKGTDRLIHPDSQGVHTEAYNTLLTRMAFLPGKDPLRFVLVTSPTAQDGKTTVAANLAVRMAKSGKKTLLIDANLRNPGLYEMFNLPREKAGLTNVLLAFAQTSSDSSYAARISLDPYIHKVGISNLQLMPSGPLPPNPPELLSSRAMDLLHGALTRNDAEVIIFDASSLLSSSDTEALLTKVDGVVLVVDIQRADKRDLNEVEALLALTDLRVPGCVVNKLKRRNGAIRQGYNVENGRKRLEQASSTYIPVKQSAHSAPVALARKEEPAKVN